MDSEDNVRASSEASQRPKTENLYPMSIKSDRWIRRMALEHGMIDPFEPDQIKEADGRRIVSYGTSSYGYDIRCADEFKLFTNINSTIVDPKNFDSKNFVDVKGEHVIIPPNSFALARTVEYFRIPRNVLTVCLGKSTYARCFRGDTRVALVDGTAPTLEEMAGRAETGELFWGYSIGRDGRVIVTMLESPRYIGRDSLVEVVLDNKESVYASPDHQFMMRDGSMTAAHELQPGDSLMPLYRWPSSQNSYVIYQPDKGDWTPSHFMLEEWKTLWQVRQGMISDSPSHGDFDLPIPAPLHQVKVPAHPMNHKVMGVRQVLGEHDVYCLTVPEAGNFALEAGVFVHNCGILVNVTPFEPEWEGYVTLEFSNTTPLPAKIYANEGVAQVIFFESDEICETSYKDRGGKYLGQHGVTLPKL
jgi:deoxycytidine triphosphate deaminase